MDVNTLLKVLEQLLHKIKANRRREIVLIAAREDAVPEAEENPHYFCAKGQMQIEVQNGLDLWHAFRCTSEICRKYN